MPSLAWALSKRLFKSSPYLFWQKVGSEEFGKPVYFDPGGPVSLMGRWEDSRQEMLMPDGRRVVARGFLTTATDLLPEGSLVFEGTTEDWMLTPSFPNPPTWNDGGREVIKTNDAPDPRPGLEPHFQVWMT